MEATINGNIVATGTVTNKRLIAGYILSVIPILFLLMDGIMKIFKPGVVVDATKELGYSESVIVPLGIVLIVSTIIYAIPRTAVFGAVLLTGYLGGAVATHVRVGGPAFNVVFPLIVASLFWGGLYLRDQRVAQLLPFRAK